MCCFMRLPYISKCCCYISLRISAYLIGFLQSLFGLAFMIYALKNHLTEKQTDDQDHGHDHYNADQNIKLYKIGIGSVLLLLGLMLVLGVKIKNVVLIKLYIVLEIIGLVVVFIMYVMILIHLFMAFVIGPGGDHSIFVTDLTEIFAITKAQVLVFLIVVVFAIIALKAYFMLCVNSYLKELIKLRSGTVGYTVAAELNTKV